MEKLLEQSAVYIYGEIQKRDALEKEITSLEENLKNKKEELKKFDANIDSLKADLLAEMNSIFYDNLECGDVIAKKFTRENITYSSDAEVLTYLKEHEHPELIRVKVTESLDKNALKKALKTDEQLSKDLEGLTKKETTEYLVVTTKEKYIKMLEHIDGKN